MIAPRIFFHIPRSLLGLTILMVLPARAESGSDPSWWKARQELIYLYDSPGGEAVHRWRGSDGRLEYRHVPTETVNGEAYMKIEYAYYPDCKRAATAAAAKDCQKDADEAIAALKTTRSNNDIQKEFPYLQTGQSWIKRMDAGPLVALTRSCPECRAQRPSAPAKIIENAKHVQRLVAEDAIRTRKPLYKVPGIIASQLGQCITPPRLKTNQEGYDANMFAWWDPSNSRRQKPAPSAPLPMIRQRRLDETDLRQIDGLARTIFSEVRGCADDDPAADTHCTFEMVAATILNRVDKITQGEAEAIANFGRSNRPTMSPLEQVLSRDSSYSCWNAQTDFSANGKARRHRHPMDKNFPITLCPEQDFRTASDQVKWREAMELAYWAYTDPSGFKKTYRVNATDYTHRGDEVMHSRALNNNKSGRFVSLRSRRLKEGYHHMPSVIQKLNSQGTYDVIQLPSDSNVSCPPVDLWNPPTFEEKAAREKEKGRKHPKPAKRTKVS